MVKIALIAPPWQLFDRPSVQTGTLAAYIRDRIDGVEADQFHPYLDLASFLGFETYHLVSQWGWAAESVCASLLFPRQQKPCRDLFHKTVTGKGDGRRRLDFDAIAAGSGKTLERFVEDTDWRSYGLVGLSASLNQLTASLYLARLIKERAPDTPVVLGGASCSGPVGPALLKEFDQLDFVVSGEGEAALESLVRGLMGLPVEPPPNLHSREGAASPGSSVQSLSSAQQIKDLDSLPSPDYDAYFKKLASMPASARFSPTLPIEASRGCWWGRCSFCNLNIQWRGYRAKSSRRVAAEGAFLAQRYGCLDLAFMDNALPRREAVEILEKLDDSGMDFKIFAELRAVYGREEIAAMASCGLSHAQIGIEALSPSLLKRLKKGVSLMDNVAAMRHCSECGIQLGANLIIHFPGSTPREVDETLKALEFLWPFEPLKTVSFWLGLGSPAQVEAGDYGIRRPRPHRAYRAMFPGPIFKGIPQLIMEYQGDRTSQLRLWRPVEKAVSEWIRNRQKVEEHGSLLTFRDGVTFLLIRQVTPGGKVLRHKLQGPSRKIYLDCLNPVEIDHLAKRYPGLPREAIEVFVDQLVEKRLMFKAGGKVLSLACRARDGQIMERS